MKTNWNTITDIEVVKKEKSDKDDFIVRARAFMKENKKHLVWASLSTLAMLMVVWWINYSNPWATTANILFPWIDDESSTEEPLIPEEAVDIDLADMINDWTWSTSVDNADSALEDTALVDDNSEPVDASNEDDSENFDIFDEALDIDLENYNDWSDIMSDLPEEDEWNENSGSLTDLFQEEDPVDSDSSNWDDTSADESTEANEADSAEDQINDLFWLWDEADVNESSKDNPNNENANEDNSLLTDFSEDDFLAEDDNDELSFEFKENSHVVDSNVLLDVENINEEKYPDLFVWEDDLHWAAETYSDSWIDMSVEWDNIQVERDYQNNSYESDDWEVRWILYKNYWKMPYYIITKNWKQLYLDTTRYLDSEIWKEIIVTYSWNFQSFTIEKITVPKSERNLVETWPETVLAISLLFALAWGFYLRRKFV